MELLKELTEDYGVEHIPILEALNKAVRELDIMKKGGKVTNKMVNDFLKGNNKLTQASMINALAARQQYKTNTRDTISFFARTPYEKRNITKLVKTLTGSKMFKLHRTRYAEGGKYWELKKVKSGF